MGLNPNDLASWGRFPDNQGKIAVSSEEQGAHAFRLGSVGDGNYRQEAFEATLDNLAALSTDIGKNVTGEILATLLEIQTLVVAGGTSAAVGIGITSDPDKYGKTTNLTKNQKITNLIATGTAGEVTAEDIIVSMVTAGGAIGDTAATAGKVRLTVFYRELKAYANTT